MSKVYISQEPKQNTQGWAPSMAPAAQYGALDYVFEKNEQPFMDTEGAVLKARKKLELFNQDTDFVCWPNSGDPAALWITIMVLCELGVTSITYLYWNRERSDDGTVAKGKGYYHPVKVEIENIADFFN